MKLNYFTYTVTDLRSHTISFENIAEILSLFCKNRKTNHLSKDKGLKKLYLAKPSSYENIFYLTTPAIVTQYFAVNRLLGLVNEISSVLKGESLEKVTYIYTDPQYPIIGLTEGRGVADVDDLEFFVNEIINHGFKSRRYEFKISRIKMAVKRNAASKFKLITEAKVRLNNNSASEIVAGFFGKEPSDNMEVEIIIKRTNKKENIKEYIKPLLDSLDNNEDKGYSDIYFKAKVDEFQSNVKQFVLDSNQNLFDFINPQLKSKIEVQILEKRYKNQVVVNECTSYIKGLTGRVQNSLGDDNWDIMKTKEYHEKE